MHVQYSSSFVYGTIVLLSIDDKNIDFRIKNIKNMFFHFYKKTLKNMHKNIKTTKVIKWV